jgi:hypothetical protein
MCRVYLCHVGEWAEDHALEAVDLLVAEFAKPKSGERVCEIVRLQGIIAENDPRLIGLAEQEFATIQAQQYDDWLEYRAGVARIHNKFRRGIMVVNVDLEAVCPI